MQISVLFLRMSVLMFKRWLRPYPDLGTIPPNVCTDVKEVAACVGEKTNAS